MKSKTDDKRVTHKNESNSSQNIPHEQQAFDSKKEVAKQKMLGKYNKLEFHKVYNKHEKTIKSEKIKDKQLDGSLSNLTLMQVSSLLKHLVAEKSDASTLLLLSLFTGRNLKDNPDRINFKKQPSPHVDFEVHRTNYKIGDEIKDKFKTTDDRLILNLPIWFKGVNDYNYDTDNYKHDISKLLKKININQNHKISLNSIANYLDFWCTNKGFDTTEIAIINGDSIDNVSGVHYYLTTSSHLQLKFDHYLNHLEGLQQNTFQPVINDSNTWVGSQLAIDNQFLSEVFADFRERIINFHFSGIKTIHEHHNLITLYTLFILNISTGHRAVNDIYTKISSFNMILKTVFINDKSRENTLASRIAVLTNTGFDQLNSYLSYLRYYTINFKYINTDTTSEVLNMLDGKSSLFKFFVNGKLETISSEYFTIETNKIIPAPSNWHRHFIRTYLGNNDVQGDLIDMYMGHEGVGGYGLSFDSSRSLADLKDVAKVIDEMFHKLSIKPTGKYK